MEKTSTFQLIGEKIATKKFDLKNKLSTLFNSYMYENSLKNYIFVYYEGDATIDGHLHLDIDAGWVTNDASWRESLNIAADDSIEQNYGVRGIIVTGDLTVNGSIINSNGNRGAFLYVLGDLKAKNLIGGGAYLSISNNAIIEGITYGHYNDGQIDITGDLSCPIFINEDHDIQYNKLINNTIFLDSNTDHFMDSDDDGNYIIPKKLWKDLITDIVVWSDILTILGEGENILLSQGAKSSTKDSAYWLAKVNKNYNNLAKVPKGEISAALCEIAVKQSGHALQYVPVKMKTLALCELALSDSGYALEFVPATMITKALCYQAARKKTAVEYIPEELLDYELALEIVTHSEYQINILTHEHWEDDFIDKKMLVAYVKGGSADYLSDFCEELNIDMHEVVMEVVPISLEMFDKIPVEAVNQAVYDLAEKCHGKHPNWQAVAESHSRKNYGGNLTDSEIEQVNQLAKYKLDYALENVWAYQLDADYCISLIKKVPYFNSFCYIPKDTFNEDLVMALLKNVRDEGNLQYVPKRLMAFAKEFLKRKRPRLPG
jgi:hypothetical protein